MNLVLQCRSPGEDWGTLNRCGSDQARAHGFMIEWRKHFASDVSFRIHDLDSPRSLVGGKRAAAGE